MSSAFDNILNFRDVGQFVNRFERQEILSQRKLYRSARPDSASVSDKQKLYSDYGIKTIIDLRSKTEHIEAAQKYTKAAKLANSAAVSLTNDQIAKAVQIPGIQYAKINLNGKGFERHLVWQLSYGQLASLATHMLFGYRMQGISIIGKNVLQPRGLIGLGQDTLQHSGPEIKEVFDVLSNPASYPLLVHCTQGKDRTGVVVMLVLLLCGISVEAITADYVKSEVDLMPEFEERMKEITSIGLDESFAKCPPEFVPTITHFIISTYGSIEAYLSHISVCKEQIEQIRKQMMN